MWTDASGFEAVGGTQMAGHATINDFSHMCCVKGVLALLDSRLFVFSARMSTGCGDEQHCADRGGRGVGGACSHRPHRLPDQSQSQPTRVRVRLNSSCCTRPGEGSLTRGGGGLGEWGLRVLSRKWWK